MRLHVPFAYPELTYMIYSMFNLQKSRSYLGSINIFQFDTMVSMEILNLLFLVRDY